LVVVVEVEALDNQDAVEVVAEVAVAAEEAVENPWSKSLVVVVCFGSRWPHDP
jgi:hypothetical protein